MSVLRAIRSGSAANLGRRGPLSRGAPGAAWAPRPAAEPSGAPGAAWASYPAVAPGRLGSKNLWRRPVAPPAFSFRGSGLLLALLFLLLAGCALDYEEGRVAEELSEEIPSTRLVNAEITVIREGTLVVTAALLESYPKQDRQILEEITFLERGPDGKVRLEGRATRAVHHLDTDDIELAGEIHFYSAVEDAAIESDFLYWEEEAEVLRGSPEGSVAVSEADGTSIEGRGFRADGRRRTVSFQGGVSGTIVTDAEEESE